ncbi:hypothetical protein MMC11_004589 [Xylographa trunciseda]|nr:hypothetical protein [Xylographa trunciseda]
MSWTICQGQNISCTSNSSSATFTLEVDPDVAGYGVLAAFIATAFATLVTIYIGYITDSLESAELNGIDAKAVARLRRILRLPALPEQLDAQAKKAKDIRSEGLLRFILTFSDQQLVTGLALLIATFAKRCTITGNDFQIATALAWFSSMTHLATLSVLRLYFLRRPRVRFLRLIGMLIVLGLLLAAEFIPAIGAFDVTVPIQCSFQSLTSVDLYDDVQFSFGSPISNPISFTFLMIYLCIAYGNRIVSLYHNDPTVTFVGNLLRKARKGTGYPEHADYRDRARQALESINGTARRSILRKFRDNVHLIAFSFNELLNSFLWQVLVTTFGFSYGLLEVCNDRWINPAFEIVDGFDSMGFGQIVPLLLLLLPVLATIEVFEDISTALTSPSITAAPASTHKSGSQLDVSQPVDPSSSSATSTNTTITPTRLVSKVPQQIDNQTLSDEGANSSHHATANPPSTYIDSSTIPQGDKIQYTESGARPGITDVQDLLLQPITRSQGTERSIGIELHHISSSKGTGAAETSKSPIPPEQLKQIYDYNTVNFMIRTLVVFSVFFLAIFATLLAGFLPIDPIILFVFMGLWILWYFWGFFVLGYQMIARHPRIERPWTE